ncbi:hypothetical protein D3C76_1300410 [compost metagenome]
MGAQFQGAEPAHGNVQQQAQHSAQQCQVVPLEVGQDEGRRGFKRFGRLLVHERTEQHKQDHGCDRSQGYIRVETFEKARFCTHFFPLLLLFKG